jgi:hypothetical protein
MAATVSGARQAREGIAQGARTCHEADLGELDGGLDGGFEDRIAWWTGCNPDGVFNMPL